MYIVNCYCHFELILYVHVCVFVDMLAMLCWVEGLFTVSIDLNAIDKKKIVVFPFLSRLSDFFRSTTTQMAHNNYK